MLICTNQRPNNNIGENIVEQSEDIMVTFLGRPCPNVNNEDMFIFWSLICRYVNIIYWRVLQSRKCVR